MTIGKIHATFWREACHYYSRLLSRWHDIEYLELKDSKSAFSTSERIEEESERILKQLNPREYNVVLSEKGSSMTSANFAVWLEKLEMEARKICFIIGGPFGLAEKVIMKSDTLLSLSPMTWPHELSKVLLLEQLYRANCIRHNIPYHH